MKTSAIFRLSLLLCISLFIEAKPQFRFELNSKNYYDDNIYNNYYKVDDFINGLTLGSGYDFSSDRNNFQVYYIGNYSHYQKNILKSSFTHKVGLVNTTLFKEDSNPLNIGANITYRKNRDYFDIYDFRQISLYANYNHSFASGRNLLLGYLLNKNDYHNLSSFSHYENKFFAKVIFSFLTETSLMLGGEFDLKNYTEEPVDPAMSNQNSQIAVYTNVAQSLGDNTGLALHAIGRKNLSDGTRYIGDETFIYYEEELLNSIYSNEGFQYGISLTQLAGDNVILSFEAVYKTRDFVNLPVADFEGNSLGYNRNDKEFAAGAAIEYSLYNLVDGLSFIASYNYITNNSNDFFYDYNNQVFLVGFDWSY